MFFDINKEVSFVMGNIGAGKTYTIAKLVNKYKDKYPCFHNVKNLSVGYYLSTDDYKKYKLPRGSLYFVDEAGIEFNNRNWKNFDQASIRLLKYTRHDGVHLWYFSQGNDLDVSIRRVCQYTYLMNKVAWFTKVTKWQKKIIPPTEENKLTDFQDVYQKINLLPHFYLRRKKIFALYDSFAPLDNDQRIDYPFEKRSPEEVSSLKKL